MNYDEIVEILQDDVSPECYSVFAGLKILNKYGKFDIEAAGHDIVYCCDIHDLENCGITREDVINLRKVGWMFDSESGGLAIFV